MQFIYIQTLKAGKKRDVPYRLVVKHDNGTNSYLSYTFRPEISISKKDYELQKVDRLEILHAPPFCDIADEIIDLLQNQQLVFSEFGQFLMIKSQFKNIGYNCTINPKVLFHKSETMPKSPIAEYLENTQNLPLQSLEYAHRFVDLMESYYDNSLLIQPSITKQSDFCKNLNLSEYRSDPGVYFFLDELKEVIYVGKANQIKKRLQSHFSQQTKNSALDYSKIKSIQVEYTGNDIVAQLIESENIKALKPIYNIQQVKDPAPYIINKGITANGIHKLQITRKDIADNMPERYFNRASVKESLENFCNEFNLCRKHCGLEKVKGPCSNVTLKNQNCVCADKLLINDYNKQFEQAFKEFKNRKSSKIYKLKGRHRQEDAFIYMVNGIYEGYGFIDKSEIVSNTNDVLSYLNRQKNNYDTSRIVSKLNLLISKDNILTLEVS